ncbi:MAG: hypothetical protein PHP93_03370, partial [Kiritimatiellales bacterium]|nr:hypothetical protein [Kiritimatiellales bacterium]
MKRVLNLILLTVLLLGLPLAGVLTAGFPVADYLEFPPRTQYVEHASFSWPVFIVLAVVIVATVLPFIIQILKNRNAYPKERVPRSFPWWGWAGLLFGLGFWLLAWTRFTWVAPFQQHTFAPLWIAYIAIINALTSRRTGRCLLTHHTKYFLCLFPLSAGFWWFFEYLNRFVQNWHYTACDSLSGVQYFIAATLPFATVLPAVLSTEEWLATYPRMTAGLENFLPIRFKRPRRVAVITLIVSAVGLFFIGQFPDLLFPLLWLAPLLLLISFQALENSVPVAARDFQCLEKKKGAGTSCFQGLETGDW